MDKEGHLQKLKDDLKHAEWIVGHWLETINDTEYEDLYAYINDARIQVERIEQLEE